MAHMIIQLAYKAQSITEMLDRKRHAKILRRVSYAMIITLNFYNDPLFE